MYLPCNLPGQSLEAFQEHVEGPALPHAGLNRLGNGIRSKVQVPVWFSWSIRTRLEVGAWRLLGDAQGQVTPHPPWTPAPRKSDR